MEKRYQTPELEIIVIKKINEIIMESTEVDFGDL